MNALDLDKIWQDMLRQSDVCCDPLIQGVFTTGITEHRSFDAALAALLGTKLSDRALSVPALSSLIMACLTDTPRIAGDAAADMLAVYERDPACTDYVTPFLFFKGYHALQAYRVANWLWRHDRKHLAQHLQSLVSERFGIDIHPAATIGRRVIFDHGTGIVIGETAVIADDVSIFQNVTLGGTGKTSGNRHPKIARGVLIGAGAKVIGNISVGEGAKIGAGSVVLNNVAPHVTVVGNPARPVGKPNTSDPALSMDQSFPDTDFVI